MDVWVDSIEYSSITVLYYKSMQNKSNKILKKLRGNSMITEKKKYKKLTCYSSIISKFYAVPKIHTPILTFKTIISSINTHTQILSILRAKIRFSLVLIKDSFDFAQGLMISLCPITMFLQV